MQVIFIWVEKNPWKNSQSLAKFSEDKIENM